MQELNFAMRAVKNPYLCQHRSAQVFVVFHVDIGIIRIHGSTRNQDMAY